MIDPQSISMVPDNDLEGVMIQVASGTRPEDDFRRALHAAEVFLPQHRGERGERAVRPGDDLAVRIIDVRGVRAVPAFTSAAQLEKTVPEVSYARVSVRMLQAMLDASVGLVLNPEGDLSRLIDPLELAALPDAPSAEIEPVAAGDAVTVGEPEEELPEVLDPVARAAVHVPGVRALYRALFSTEESGANARLAIGVLLDDGADRAVALRDFSSLVREPAHPFAMLVVDPAAPDPVAKFMLARTRPFYVREGLHLPG